MQMYGNYKPITLFGVEALLYVNEAHLVKFMKELTLSRGFANVVHTN